MRRAYRDLVAETLIVNLKTGKSFRGVLWSEGRELLTLRNVEMYTPDGATPVDGDLVVERSDIDFIQRLP